MILRAAADGWHFITQPEHALAARRIMDRCPDLLARPRVRSILLAIEQHDNGWRETDAAPAIEPATGQAYDFVRLPLAERHAVWPRGVGRLAPRDPWAAALVAHHAVTVYSRYRPDPAWAAFFAGMEQERDRLREGTGLSAADLQGDYTYVRLADLISLTFCNAWTESQSFERWTLHLDGSTIMVTPDLFSGEHVSFEVEARQMSDRRHDSDASLQAEYDAAPTIVLRGVASGEGAATG